jgi:hypothetical protein
MNIVVKYGNKIIWEEASVHSITTEDSTFWFSLTLDKERCVVKEELARIKAPWAVERVDHVAEVVIGEGKSGFIVKRRIGGYGETGITDWRALEEVLMTYIGSKKLMKVNWTITYALPDDSEDGDSSDAEDPLEEDDPPNSTTTTTTTQDHLNRKRRSTTQVEKDRAEKNL